MSSYGAYNWSSGFYIFYIFIITAMIYLSSSSISMQTESPRNRHVPLLSNSRHMSREFCVILATINIFQIAGIALSIVYAIQLVSKRPCTI